MTSHIGTLNEKPLHAALKEWYARPGDRFEAPVDGFVVDIVRGDLLIEIQTRHLGAIRRKLTALAQQHPVRLVYPIASEKWIVKMATDGGTILDRRKSPKRGGPELVFEELVGLPSLFLMPGFALEVLLIQEEEVRRPDETMNWRRRGWATHERRLLKVVDVVVFETPADLCAMLPVGLPSQFTTRQLADALARPLHLAQKMAYCLREMGALRVVGMQSRSVLYSQVQR